jgi:hypothetical protein
MFISDPNFFHPGSRIKLIPGSRIRIRIKEFKYFNPKNCYQALGNMIQNVHRGSGSWFFTHPGSRIPDHDWRVKKAPDPGSATLLTSPLIGDVSKRTGIPYQLVHGKNHYLSMASHDEKHLHLTNGKKDIPDLEQIPKNQKTG